jgi:hypothetical protein
MWGNTQTQRGALPTLKPAMHLTHAVVQGKRANVNPALTWPPTFSHQLKR